MKQFMPLREEAEKRGKLIKAAGDRKAGPDEACELIKNFAQAEIKMMTYVEKNSAKCGIPPQVGGPVEERSQEHRGAADEGVHVAQQMQRAARRPRPRCRTCSAPRRLCRRPRRPRRAAAASTR